MIAIISIPETTAGGVVFGQNATGLAPQGLPGGRGGFPKGDPK